MRLLITGRSHERLKSAIGLVVPWAGRAGTENVPPIRLTTFLPQATKASIVSATTARLNVGLFTATGFSDSPHLIFVSVGVNQPSVFCPRSAQQLRLFVRMEQAGFWRGVDAFDVALRLIQPGLAFGQAPLSLVVSPNDPTLGRDGWGYPTNLFLGAILRRPLEVLAVGARIVSAISLSLTCRALGPSASASAGQFIPVQNLALSVRPLQPQAQRESQLAGSVTALSLSAMLRRPEVGRLDEAAVRVVSLSLTAILCRPNGLVAPPAQGAASTISLTVQLRPPQPVRVGEQSQAVVAISLTVQPRPPQPVRVGEQSQAVVAISLTVQPRPPQVVRQGEQSQFVAGILLAAQLRPVQLVRQTEQAQSVRSIGLTVMPLPAVAERREPIVLQPVVNSLVVSMRQPGFVRDLGQWNAYAHPVALRLAPLVPSPAVQSNTTVSKVAPCLRLTISARVYAGYGFAIPAGTLPSDLWE